MTLRLVAQALYDPFARAGLFKANHRSFLAVFYDFHGVIFFTCQKGHMIHPENIISGVMIVQEEY